MVGVRCGVLGCENNWPGALKDVSFFIVPKDSVRRKAWLKAIKKKYTSYKRKKLLVCELHFSDDDIVINNKRKRLVRGAMPTLDLPDFYEDPGDPPPKAQSDKEIQVPEIKCESPGYDSEILIDLFTKGEPIVGQQTNSLEDTEEPGTTFTLNGIPLKRERSDGQEEFRMACAADDQEEFSTAREADGPEEFPTACEADGEEEFPAACEADGQEEFPTAYETDGQEVFPMACEDDDQEEFPTACEAAESLSGPLQSLNRNPTHSKSTDLDLLIKLSKAYLSPELAKLIEIQALLKNELKTAFDGKQCNRGILFYALKLYHYFPQSYKLMQESLCLPSMLKLKELCRNLNWEINDTWAKVLRARFERASAAERECVVCVAKVRLQLGLGYDAVRDRMAGLDEVDGGQRTRTARSATVVYARGIFARWLQPLSYALLSTNARPDELWLWFDIIISKLFDVGLTVRALVTDFDSEFHPMIRPIAGEKTYFQVKDKQIYCLYDCTLLMLRFRDCFRTYNINFRGMIASWEVIEELYEYDSMRRYKMGAGLTSEHVRPSGAALRKAELAVQAMSPRVAAAIAAAVDLRVLDDSAHGTVQLITTFSTLYDILHSKELTVIRNKITPEVKFLNEMLMLFERIAFMDKHEMRNVPEPGILRAFRANVRAVLALQERLRRAGYAELPLRAFNNDPLQRFFNRARALNGDKDPTGRQLVDTFRRSFVFNIMKSFYTSEGKLDAFFDMASGVRDVTLEPIDESKITLVKGLVKPSHFTALMQPRATPAQLARLLLEQAWRQQPCCKTGMRFSRTPPPIYTDFLSMMERQFRLFFTTECLGEGVLNSLLASLAEDPFPAPCACFPALYLKTLYLRFRIAKLVHYNNAKFARSISRDFTMNLVQF